MNSPKIHAKNSTIPLKGKKVLLVGFWGNKNMGDELILLGNIRLLLAQGKEIYVISQDNTFLKQFLAQFIDIQQIHFIQELPRGIRSGIKYLFCYLFQLRHFFQCDEIILGGGEVLTEESENAYRYWFWSIRPAFLFKNTKLTIMGGVQIPKKKKNIRRFDAILRHTQQIYVRDFQALADLKKYSYKKVDFFMDTSYFAIEWKKYKTPAQKYIVVNLNSRGEKFLGDIIRDITEYAQKGYIIYYVPISAGLDDDRVYFEKLKKKLPKKTDLQILEREHDFKYFLKILGGAEKVVGTRLHLYLISQFIGLDTIVYPYQRKIIRMQEVLSKVAV